MSQQPNPPWNLVDEEGRLGRTVRSDQWWAPGDGGVTIRGRGLRLTAQTFDEGGMTSGDRLMLERFALLHRAGDEEARKTAGRYGMLGICTHGIVQAHPVVEAPIALAVPATIELDDGCRAQWTEPLTVWRYWSTQAWGILSAATRLRLGERPGREAWDAILAPGPWAEAATLTGPPAEFVASWASTARAGRLSGELERQAVARAASAWIDIAGVRIVVRWHRGRSEVAMRVEGLLGAIGVQLALALGDVDGWAICSGCGTFHVPRRPGDGTRRSFCPACRAAKIPVRLAGRAYRAREKASGAGT